MTPESVIDIYRHALEILIVVQAVILVPALLTGILISVFQAATQINEMTLSFIPKLFITLLVFLLAGPWLLACLTGYTRQIFESIPALLG